MSTFPFKLYSEMISSSKGYIDSHVFGALHWCVEIKILDVKATIFLFWPGQGAVDVHFECDKVTFPCCNGIRIIDEVPSHH